MMPIRLPTRRSLRSLSATEQAIVRLLRAEAGTLKSAVQIGTVCSIPVNCITDLANHLRTSKCCLAALSAPFITSDEQLALASVALLQRQSSKAVKFADAARRGALVRLADALDREGVRLPLSQAALPILQDQGWIDAQTTVGPSGVSERRRKAEARPIAYVPHGTTKWKVVEYLREHPRASSSDLKALGTTRQYISLLCADGIIDRVGFGYYTLGKRVRGRS